MTQTDYIPFSVGDEVEFRHQATVRYGYILKVDPFRKAKRGDQYGAAFVRITVNRNQTSVWIPFDRLTKVNRRRR